MEKMNKTLFATVNLFHETYLCSRLKTSRNGLDLFADRVRQAGTEPSLLAMSERLQALVDCPPSSLSPPTLTTFLGVLASGVPVLAWIRQYPRIMAMLSALKEATSREEAVAMIDIPEADLRPTGRALPRRPFDIPIEISCLSPLAHGGDAKAGNATLFRRMDVLSDSGAVLTLPFYAGNAMRGQMRDLLADHLLASLGLIPRRDKPPCSLWFFHVLYAGGALEENSAATKALGAKFGKAAGAIRTDGLREWRDLLPASSLLGTALGNRILPGRVDFGDYRPRCYEWGNGELPAAQLMEWTFLTRREDLETHDEHTGMIATTETLKAGVSLEGGIDIHTHCSDMERAALSGGLLLLQKAGKLGAENRRGLGMVEIKYKGLHDPREYDEFLIGRKDDILEYLISLEAIYAPGKYDSTSTEEAGSDGTGGGTDDED